MTNAPFRLACITLMAAIPVSASAASKADFGALAMCSKLSKMPKGYRAIECNRRNPLKECRFSLAGDKMPIQYLIDQGTIVDKNLGFSRASKFVGPFGLRSGDTEAKAMAKVKAATALAFERWTSEDSPNGAYFQSSDVKCTGNIFNLRVFFDNGVLESVSVSSLPMM